MPTSDCPLASFADPQGLLTFPEDAVPLALPAHVFDGAVLHRAHLLDGREQLLHATSPASLALGSLIELRLSGDWVVACTVRRVEPGPCYLLGPVEGLHQGPRS